MAGVKLCGVIDGMCWRSSLKVIKDKAEFNGRIRRYGDILFPLPLCKYDIMMFIQ